MRALTCAGYEYMKLMVAELQRQLNEIEKSKGKYLQCVKSVYSDIYRQSKFNLTQYFLSIVFISLCN